MRSPGAPRGGGQGQGDAAQASGPFYPEIAVMNELRDVPNVRVHDEKLLRFDDPLASGRCQMEAAGRAGVLLRKRLLLGTWNRRRARLANRRVLAEVPEVHEVAAFDRPGERSRLVLFKL